MPSYYKTRAMYALRVRRLFFFRVTSGNMDVKGQTKQLSNYLGPVTSLQVNSVPKIPIIDLVTVIFGNI